MRIGLIMLVFLSSASGFAARILNAPLMGYHSNYHNSTGEANNLICAFHNISDQAQTVTVDYYEGYADSVSSTSPTSSNTKKNAFSNIQIQPGASFTKGWASNNGASGLIDFSCPRNLIITVAESGGFLIAECLRNWAFNAGGNPSGSVQGMTAQIIQINGGRPF